MRVLSSDSIPGSMEPVSASMALHDATEFSQSSVSEMATPIEIGKRTLSPGDMGSVNRSQSSTPQVTEPSKSLDDINLVKADLEARYTPPNSLPSPRAVGPEGDLHARSGHLSTSVGYPPNRWLPGDSVSTFPPVERPGDDSYRLNSFSSTSSTADNSASILQPPSSSSQVRLSLSLDGKAELISAQPSPPRAAPQPILHAETLPPFSGRTLQRSRSAFSGITLPPISTLTKTLGAPFPPQFTRGRSRDVHAWESCCEADTRDELTRQAENEASGSAVAAISLMRSSSSSASLSNLIHNYSSNSRSPSQSGILQPNSLKRNALSAPRLSLDRKPGRTKPSTPINRYASVEASENVVDVGRDEDALGPEKKKRKSHHFILSPSGDSDKENWSPDKDGHPDHRRHLPLPGAGIPSAKTGAAVPRNPRRVGHVLGEQDAATKRQFPNGSADMRNHHMNRANTAPTLGPRMRKAGDTALSIFEDGASSDENGPPTRPRGPTRNADEVERFMRGEVSPSKRPDMDCIAGLLSLSQGNWR
ncbi:hypothetical protein GGR50DRAFT_678395 [Xylaria sp. CBS 124048]|nr:hypothetical protein GGR50DRAFT_678395 [Xylaria sp. CBS 124048]